MFTKHAMMRRNSSSQTDHNVLTTLCINYIVCLIMHVYGVNIMKSDCNFSRDHNSFMAEFDVRCVILELVCTRNPMN